MSYFVVYIILTSSVGCRSITSIFPVSFGVIVVKITGMVVCIISFTFVCGSPSCCLVQTMLLLLVSGSIVIIIFLEIFSVALSIILLYGWIYLVRFLDVASSNFSSLTVFSRSYFLFGVDFGVVFDINLQTTLLVFSVGVDVSWLVGVFLVGVVV